MRRRGRLVSVAEEQRVRHLREEHPSWGGWGLASAMPSASPNMSSGPYLPIA